MFLIMEKEQWDLGFLLLDKQYNIKLEAGVFTNFIHFDICYTGRLPQLSPPNVRVDLLDAQSNCADSTPTSTGSKMH